MLKIIVIFFVLLFFIGCKKEVADGENVDSSYGIEQLKNMEIADVDPSSVQDGEYTGKVVFRNKHLYHVEVTVKSGRIEDIHVVENGTGNKYAGKGLGVIPRIIEKQSPKVEAVSGATVTSKALMKCVEKALTIQ
ncbi:FMN-binding protein [bacterium]|nr:FMN-binding protein [bacterium]